MGSQQYEIIRKCNTEAQQAKRFTDLRPTVRRKGIYSIMSIYSGSVALIGLLEPKKVFIPPKK